MAARTRRLAGGQRRGDRRQGPVGLVGDAVRRRRGSSARRPGPPPRPRRARTRARGVSAGSRLGAPCSRRRGPCGSARVRRPRRACAAGSRCRRRGSSSPRRSRSPRCAGRSWSGRARCPRCGPAAPAGRTRSSRAPAPRSAHHARRAAGSTQQRRRPAARCPAPPSAVSGAEDARRSSARSRASSSSSSNGLGEVVVGARVQARDPVRGLDPRGEHQHRGAVALGAQHAADREPVDARHHHVDHERIEGVAPRSGQGLDPVGHGRDVVALELESARERLPDGAVVIGDQDALRHPHHGARSPVGRPHHASTPAAVRTRSPGASLPPRSPSTRSSAR